VYEAEEVAEGVKAEVVDPDKYQMLDALLTRHKRRIREVEDAQLQDPYRQHRRCYVFLTYHCAHNGLPLGPSSLLRHTLPSRTDYDSYTSF
jgi:hypothetical protein